MSKKTVLVDRRLPMEAELSLIRLGYRVIRLPAFSHLGEAVASHTDMLVFKIGRELVFSADWCDEHPEIPTQLLKMHPNLKLSFAPESFGAKYPSDAHLNALLLGKRLFARKKSISSTILSLIEEKGIELIDVNQGYAACTVLPLGQTCALSADPAMINALERCSVKVYKIRDGGISLPPYEYGFIGGAAGIDGGRVMFIGDVDTHPDGKIIRQAAAEAGYSVVCLCKGKLCDLGGMVFID